MSKHFEDARYYLGRAAEHAKAGVKEELAPIEARVKDLVGVGEDEEPEPSRLDRLQADLKELEERAEGEAREAVASARERVAEYRGRDAAAAK
jgi:molecular chaperone GrpE (heat shock protein)